MFFMKFQDGCFAAVDEFCFFAGKICSADFERRIPSGKLQYLRSKDLKKLL